MLMPKRVKFRKAHRGRRKGNAKRGSSVAFGDFGLKSLEPAWITSRQIEACRVALSRKMKRDGRVWIRIFPDKPVSKKPLETRMGKGKGGPEFWVAVVKPAEFCLKFQALQRKLLMKHFDFARTSYRLKLK